MLKKRPVTATTDRRKGIRISKSFEVSLCPSQYLLRTNALSRDISEDGICLVSPQRMDIGQQVELEIRLPKSDKPVKAIGEVMRRNETDDPKYPYLLGIQFITIEPLVRDEILEHMRFYIIQG